MMNDIITKIILSVVGFVVTGVLGYLVATIKTYKKKDLTEHEALKCLLRSTMVNQYFVYKQNGSMPYYCKESWYAMYEAYTGLGGNSFIKDVKLKIDEFDVKEEA